MRILVTGGNGFVGANLIRRLVHDQHEVCLILRTGKLNWRTQDLEKRLTTITSNLSNLKDLKKMIKNFQPDLVFHTAVYGAYHKVEKDFFRMVTTNIIGTANLIESISQTPMINLGSSSEYGLKNKPMKENDICLPTNDYGITKLTQTQYCRKKGIPTIRIFSPFGPFEDDSRLFPKLILAKLKKEEISLIDSVRDYIYIEDIVDALLKAGKNYSKIRGETINISSGKQTSMRELIKYLYAIDPKPIKINWNFQAVQYEPKNWVADISKARRYLKWEPKYSLEEGLKLTYYWWVNKLMEKIR